MISFFERFGECREHLMFVPHLAKFFALQLFENWKALGKPRRLIIEIGGTYQDNEVSAYIVQGLKIIMRLSDKMNFFLLTEAGFNREGIKVKPVIHSLVAGRTRGLLFDTVFARLPAEFPRNYDGFELARYIERKICDSMVYDGRAPNIICVPYFEDVGLEGYTEYLRGVARVIFPPDFGA